MAHSEALEKGIRIRLRLMDGAFAFEVRVLLTSFQRSNTMRPLVNEQSSDYIIYT